MSLKDKTSGIKIPQPPKEKEARGQQRNRKG
jgi:hypothetical protein